MKKCIIIPDSFKGSLSSIEICAILREKLNEYFPICNAVCLPIADGGEGTVDCFVQAIGGQLVDVPIENPYFEPITARYLIHDDTAVIEMAAAAGLTMVENRKNPLLTSTYGVGMLIGDALEKNVKTIIIGLGGSCTNDGGTGMACALGTKFYNAEGNEFIPTGGTLCQIRSIDNSQTEKRLNGHTVIAMCDIDNPMYGTCGAAYVFAPQKGANNAMVCELDRNLIHLSGQIKQWLGKDVSVLPGSGAAGAMGAGVSAFLNGKLQSGIRTVLDLVKFDEQLNDADLVLTGEGKIDTQSLRGKVVIGVAERAKEKNVPVIALVGDVGDNIQPAYDRGVSAIFSINRVAVPFEKARQRSRSDLRDTADNLFRLLALRIQ